MDSGIEPIMPMSDMGLDERIDSVMSPTAATNAAVQIRLKMGPIMSPQAAAFRTMEPSPMRATTQVR